MVPLLRYLQGVSTAKKSRRHLGTTGEAMAQLLPGDLPVVANFHEFDLSWLATGIDTGQSRKGSLHLLRLGPFGHIVDLEVIMYLCRLLASRIYSGCEMVDGTHRWIAIAEVSIAGCVGSAVHAERPSVEIS